MYSKDESMEKYNPKYKYDPENENMKTGILIGLNKLTFLTVTIKCS